LIGQAPDHGAALLVGRIGRAYLDLNREAADLDPLLIEGVDPDRASVRTTAGYGVIPRLSGDGRALYGRRLDRTEAEARLTAVHAPYHAALEDVMRRTHARHGRAMLIDWHSMPSRAVGGARGADVVLGDCHGASCAADLTRRTRAAFERLGWRVALNQPYAGGWTTRRWGRPAEGFHALQIELSRALYMNEATGEVGPGWRRCASGVARVIAELTGGG
jgi:N-formylglutamate amidohydrolase